MEAAAKSKPVISLAGGLSLPLLVLIGASLNGFAVRIAESLHLHGLVSPFVGLSPFDIVIVGVATWLVASGLASASDKFRLGAAEVIAGLLILVPSSAVSWAALAGYASVKAVATRGGLRTGLVLFAALGLASLWASIGMKLVALPITSLEASLVGWGLSAFKSGVIVNGNVVGVAGEHLLILMAACSTFDSLPKALVALAAVSCFLGGWSWRDFLLSGGVLAVIFAAANLVRLGMMAWSRPMYELAHGPIGANVFDVTVTLAIFGLAVWRDKP